MIQLVIPHFFLGLGIGVIDSALMPLLAKMTEEKYGKGEEKFNGMYGQVYAIAQTAVSLAYGLGPLIGNTH